MQGVPEFGTISAWAVDSEESDAYWLNVSDYLTPELGRVWARSAAGTPSCSSRCPRSSRPRGCEVTQHFVESEDGTRVPYFQIGKKDLATDGSELRRCCTATVASRSRCCPATAAGVRSGVAREGRRVRGLQHPRWRGVRSALAPGGACARTGTARTRTSWPIARDLIEAGRDHARTSWEPMGGSNGGLLMGNMYTLYPDDFGAIVCRVPLLDMKRYTKLLAGASWAGEYGDPDVPEDWEFIQTFSPYHNIDPDKTSYPPMLLMTSTRDDRVHPGHARKMMAALVRRRKGRPVLREHRGRSRRSSEQRTGRSDEQPGVRLPVEDAVG